MSDMLSLENVSISYGAIRAVRNVSLKVSQGEIVTLLGPNGAGKSTTLNGIVGLQPVASGQITFNGRSITNLATEKIVQLGLTLTPEGRRVFAGLSVGENLRLGAASRKDKKAVRQTEEELFELFPILKDRLDQAAGSFSGGEQQQLAIARSLASNPQLLLLDEPSLGLAPQIVDQIFDLIVELRRRGRTILLVEQNTELSLEVSDRGYVFSNGEVALSGTAEELRSSDDVAAAYLGMEA